jgi:ABC-2 type transport system ATP-binding protein
VTAQVLVCRGLKKKYGERWAVDGVGFEIAAGECYGLLGPNGAGKTTTISLICGLLDGDGGEVEVSGLRVTLRSLDAKAHIGYVPQDLALYPSLNARQNLHFFGRLYGLKGAALAERIDIALGIVGLADRAEESIENYSGGMKRRANIAAGLLHEPALLVLDEPTVGVDPQSRHAILETVRELADKGMAVLYTTHYMEEAERLCDRLLIIVRGQIIAGGAPQELINENVSAYALEIRDPGERPLLADFAEGVRAVGRAGAHIYFADSPDKLSPLLKLYEGGRVLLRPSNLEDVFLDVLKEEDLEEELRASDI